MSWLKNSDDKIALAIIPDTGINYLDQIYDDNWLQQKGVNLLEKTQLQQKINSKEFINPSDLESKDLIQQL